MSTKTCSECKEDKPIEVFTYKSKANLCEPCAKEYYKNEYQKNRERHISNRALYYEKNKEAILQKMATPEEKAKRNARNKERRKNDPSFAISESLKVRIVEVLRTYKSESSSYLIGCTKRELMSWLEYQFDDNMSWDNYGKYWHVDHVIPISFFDITKKEEQLVCFNWKNLRPLEKGENVSKFNTVDKNIIVEHSKILNEFVDINQEYQKYYENSIWSRISLEYGKNTEDEVDIEVYLKSIIRIEDS